MVRCPTDPTPGHWHCTCITPHQGDHWCALCKAGYPRTYEEHTGSQKHRRLLIEWRAIHGYGKDAP